MKKPRDVIQPRWRPYLLKRKAERLPFTIACRNSGEAIEHAVREHDIPERERFRGQRAFRRRWPLAFVEDGHEGVRAHAAAAAVALSS